MHKLTRIAALLLWVVGSVSQAQTDVGHGGDSVTCRPESNSLFAGDYALDYLVTYRGSNDNADVIAVGSWQESLGRISDAIRTRLPALHASFVDFADSVRNTQITRRRVWREAAFGLVDLQDERLVELLPPNCMVDGRIKVVQTVIRLKPWVSGLPAHKIAYAYVPSVFDRLATTAPLQLSFLLVHEWLWDVSDNVAVNRHLNRLLHSNEFFAMTPVQARDYFETMGVDVSGRPPVRLDAYGHGVCATVGDKIQCWGTAHSFGDGRVVPGLRDIDVSVTSLCALSDSGAKCFSDEGEMPIGAAAAPSTTFDVVAINRVACAATSAGIKCAGPDFLTPSVPSGTKSEVLSSAGTGLCGATQGKLKCWDTAIHDVPHLEGVTAIDGYYDGYGCAVADGRVVCFGDDYSGRVQAPFLTNAKMVSTGSRHACALTQERQVVCWGSSYGYANPPLLDGPFAVAAGDQFTCAADRQGIKCWGSPQHDWPLQVPANLRQW